MKLKQMVTFIIIWTFLPFGLTDTCGRLEVEYIRNLNTIDCKIQLYPSTQMHSYITQLKLYRWIHIRDSTPTVILQKNAGTFDTVKYGEENYTLLIRNLTESDEGNYRVHCWVSDSRVNYFSPEVTVSIPTDITTTARTPVRPTSTAGIGTTALIIVSLCAVIIVAIIAGTTFLILRRRKNGQEGETRLVSDESQSGNIHSLEKEESVYNEIDITKVTPEYAKVDGRAVTAASAAPIQMEKSPALPTRGHVNLDNHYDLISSAEMDTNTKFDTPESEYAEVAVNSSENEEALKLKPSGKPHEQDLGKYNNNSEKMAGAESSVKNVKIDKFSEYAKVNKRSPIDKMNESGTAITIKTKEYKVNFPKINCSEITQSLGEGLGNQPPLESSEAVTYLNLVSRPQRIKSRQSRASRKSLQYAILDLAQSDEEHIEQTKKAENILQALQPCQYASIDFEKKAFVAPIRKAPSSWYKRKKKKSKENKS